MSLVGESVISRLVCFVAVCMLLVFGGARPGFAADNLALNKPVTATAALWPGFPEAFLTDGNPGSFTHPATGVATLGFEFEVDLHREFLFERIVIRNRADGCCPERLSRYRIEIYADNGGESGALNWSGLIRGDGSNSGVAGTDTVTAAAGSGAKFSGRFVRVVNTTGDAYNPQLAEIEVYGQPGPQILKFAADEDTLAAGASTTLRWDIVNAAGAAISPVLGVVAPTNGFALVRPETTTTYTLTATNDAGATVATAKIGVNVTLAPPRISEFLADNATGLRDDDGDYSDWIELENPNEFGLSLAGYSLTDDPTDRRKWIFPAARLPAHGRLVVFATGEDRRDPAAPLHTNFRIGAGGDYLGLIAPDGVTVVSQFPPDYPATTTFLPQTADVSYGAGSQGTTGFLRPPTPGTTNGAAFAGVVGELQFSKPRGFYDTAFSLTLTTTTPQAQAQIRYTTNRTEPTATSGLIYSAPIPLSATTVIRAAAFRTGWAPTKVQTHTYVFPSNVISSSVMRTTITTNATYAPRMRAALLDVPSVSVVTTASINGSSEVKASFEWLTPGGGTGVQENCGVRNYGGAYTDFAKKNFRLYFRSEYGAPKLRHPLFAGFERGLRPAEEFDQLELRSGSHDMEMRGFYLSNIFTDDTMLEAGHLNPHGRFVHLYLNGTYWGLFHLRERWNAAMHESYLGGAREDYESVNGNLNVGGWAEPGTPYDGDGSAWERVKSLRGNYNAVRPLLDVPEYVDYMLMWMFGGSEDEYRCVGPTVPGSGLKFYLNDADGWFCVPNYCAAGDRTARGAPGRASGDGPGSLFSMLFKEGNPEYRILLADHIHRALFHDGVLTPARNASRLRARTDGITNAFLAESARWNYLTPVAWQQRRDSVFNSWLPRRTDEALAQFRGAGFYPQLDAPTLSQQGGVVTNGYPIQFTGPSRGTVYFTLDGSDPRRPGGAVSPQALSYRTGGSTEVPVPVGSRWRWFTSANGLSSSDVVVGHPQWTAADWKHPGFNDANWSEGAAQLGYGENDEATQLPFGPDGNNKWPSAYFRHRFTLTNLAGIIAVNVRLKRDDGAVIYLNGRELTRSSMPAGTVTATTLADNASDDGQGYNPISLPVSALQLGENVLAIEMHQSSPGSSDLSFDFELGITRSGAAAGDVPALTRNTVLKARTLEGSQWSALNETFFQVGAEAAGAGDVAVSELNFNPAGPDDDTEFVELANLSTRAVNLRGARFTSGLTFTFPDNRDTLLAPGQRLLLVKDLFRFQQRYGWEIPVAGIIDGDLNNGGETISLANGSGQSLLDVTYGNPPFWPDADGSGFTLVLNRPEFGLSNPQSWRVSATTNASPGVSDSVVFTGNPAADVDQDGLSALLEHALGTSDSDAASGPGAITTAVVPAAGFTISFPRNLRADDANIAAESSTDLQGWQTATRTAAVPDGNGIARETWLAPDTGQSAMFLRVRVTLR